MKIMMLHVYGGIGDFQIDPWYRLVEVVDEDEFIAQHRVIALRELQREMNTRTIPEGAKDELQAAILRSVKVKLYDTGLTEYPATEAEEVALYNMMFQTHAIHEEVGV